MLVCQALSLLPRETFFAAAAGFLSYKARDMPRYGEIWGDTGRLLSYKAQPLPELPVSLPSRTSPPLGRFPLET